MNHQLATIATGINNLPLNITESLADVRTSPHSTSGPPYTEFKPRVSNLLPQLDRKNFQKVVHWEQGLYNRLRKKANATGDEDSDVDDALPKTLSKSGKKVSTLSCYMEDENGAPISNSQKDAARAKAKGFWNKLWDRGQAPSSHGTVDVDTNESYIALLEDAFPWLRYCESHWKSEQIWRNHYTQWFQGREEKAAKEKAAKEKAAKEKAAKEKAAGGEIIDVDANSSDGQDSQEKSSKRPQVDGEASEPKRRRVEEDADESLPPPRPEPIKITTNRLRVRLTIFPCYILY